MGTVQAPSTDSLTRLIEAAEAAGRPLPADAFVPSDNEHGATRRSLYRTMRDGVRVAVDVWVPSRHGGERFPTVIRSTRYHRARVGDPLAEHTQSLNIARWIRSGFAHVAVDARGTGASFGVWTSAWADDQRDDLAEIVDWVTAQAWSDGTVTGVGTSYEAGTTHLLAATGHPAVRAVVPRFPPFDGWHHMGAPGGVPNDWMIATWGAGVWHLDGHPDRASVTPAFPIIGGVRLVDEDVDGQLLAHAVQEHAANWDLWTAVRAAGCREDALADGKDAERSSPFGRLEELRAARKPMWLWSSWFDGALAAGVLAQLADPALDVRATIGPWSHGAGMTMLGDPFKLSAPMDPGVPEQQRMIAAFMRHHIDGSVPDPSPRRLRYYTLGDGWHESAAWPPAGTAPRRSFLGAGGALVDEPADGALRYDIDFDATTGTSTRWHTLIGGVPVVYPDRAKEDRKLLVWETTPLERDVEITGTPAALLHVRSSAADGAFFVYLEDVAPDGRVTYITEGELRAVHRKPGVGRPPYETFGPWHTYVRADMEPLVAGEVAELEFALWPTSVLIRSGHRIRIALACADRSVFRRIPAEGPVTIEVLHSSYVDLPIRDPAAPLTP